MALRNTYNLKSFEADTAAEISDVVFKKNDMILALDTGETKKGDGETSFSNLPVFGSGGGADTVAWSEVTGKPSTFPPVVGTTAKTAKAGNYQPTWAQVTGKPTIPTNNNELTNGAGYISSVPAQSWTSITGKPSTFTPAAHEHPFTEITGTAVAGQIPTLPIGKISGLQTELNNKIAYADLSGVSDSVATDVAGLVEDFNALLAILKGS